MHVNIDGANLLDGINGNHKGSGLENSTISTGGTEDAQKRKQAETWSKSEKQTEAVYQKPQQEHKSGTVEDVMQQAENMDAAQMKKQMVVASNTTTTTNGRQVEEEGFSLNNTKIETIVTVTDKIKIQLAKAGVDISYFGDSLNASQLETLTGDPALAQELAGKIEKQAEFPLTKENIADFQKTIQQAKELQNLQDGALKYLLDNGLMPTIANLYQAQYCGSAVYQSQQAEQMDLSGMQEQISKIIAQAGQNETKQTIDDSIWLIQNEIPLTAENLEYYEQLKDLDLPLTAENMEDVVGKILTSLAEGNRPQDAMLIDHYSMAEQAQQAVDVLHQTTDEDLAYTIYKHEPITIQSLGQAHALIQAHAMSTQEAEGVAELIQNTDMISAQQQTAADNNDMQTAAQQQTAADSNDMQTAAQQQTAADSNGIIDSSVNTSKMQPEAVQTQTNTENLQPEAAKTQTTGIQNGNAEYTHMQIALVTARRQLEEIRLSMTVNASYEMLKHGISVNTKSMEELIQQLKEIETGYFRQLLTEGGYKATEANLSLFAETEEKIEQLKEMPAYALGTKNLETHTLAQLHEEGKQMQQNFQQANERYETMQTQVRKDLGDSIKKAFSTIDDILKELGQDLSDANQRAARILGYNRIEITPENLMRMKAADQQVQQVFQNLTPAVVREFIEIGRASCRERV